MPDCYLYDCVTPNWSERTGFICHSSVAQKYVDSRDRYSQGVISLSIPVAIDEGALEEALDCPAILRLISSLGVGINLGDPKIFELARLRYGRLVLVNAGDGGREFVENVLAAIHVLLSPVIEHQHLWIANVDLTRDEALIERTITAARLVVLGSSVEETLRLNLS